jgi:hypothetical protein
MMRLMAAEVIEQGGTKYAEVIWADTAVERSTLFSPAESSFQFGLLAHEAGYQEKPQFHKSRTREINDLQQMFVAQRGRFGRPAVHGRRPAFSRRRLGPVTP